MKKIALTALLMANIIFSQAQSTLKQGSHCDLGVNINNNYSKAAVLDSLMKAYTTKLLPGVSIAVYTEKEGWWAGAQGNANTERKMAMDKCHLQYIQSVSKMYLAVEILQLKELGKIKFDEPVSKYLPAKYSRYIKELIKLQLGCCSIINQVYRSITVTHYLFRW